MKEKAGKNGSTKLTSSVICLCRVIIYFVYSMIAQLFVKHNKKPENRNSELEEKF